MPANSAYVGLAAPGDAGSWQIESKVWLTSFFYFLSFFENCRIFLELHCFYMLSRSHQGYQFWTKSDESGKFTIRNIRAGKYNLFAFVPGFIGDYRYDVEITISSGPKFVKVLYPNFL